MKSGNYFYYQKELFKFCLIIAVVFLFNLKVSAQDLLIKKNGEEIQVKVDEISLTDIKYHLWGDTTRKFYNIRRYDVFMIKYFNGMKEIFNNEPNPEKNRSALNSVNNSYKIITVEGKFYNATNLKRIKLDSLEKIMSKNASIEIYKNIMHELKLRKKRLTIGYLIFIPSCLVGGTLSIVGLAPGNQILLYSGAGVVLAGITSLVWANRFASLSERRIELAIRKYNNSLNID